MYFVATLAQAQAVIVSELFGMEWLNVVVILSLVYCLGFSKCCNDCELNQNYRNWKKKRPKNLFRLG